MISDDAVTGSLPVFMQTRCAAPHDWLALTGGAIGQAMPLAIGAAVASPGRKVAGAVGGRCGRIHLQALWTIAREGLDVTTVIFANHTYRILGIELSRTRSGQAGSKAKSSSTSARRRWTG